MSARSERRAVFVVLAFSFVLFSYYSLATPLFEASDELWHYPMVQHLATTVSLPVQRPDQTDADAPWRQEGSQPPLYYAIAALVTAPLDSTNWREIRRLNPHADMGRPTQDGNANAVVHTLAEQFPWTRAALAVRVARLVSIIFSVFTVFFTYRVASELIPRRESMPNLAFVRLGAMLFTACIPMFAFISGSVNNDNAAAMFATAGLWLAIRTARNGDLSVRNGLLCGVLVAAAALSKSSTLGLAGLFVLAAVFAALKQVSNGVKSAQQYTHITAKAIRYIAIFSAVTLFLAGWWFIRNQALYGDLLGWNAFLDSVGRRVPPATLAQLWTEREGFVWAFWGVFGTLNVIMPPIIYDILNGLVVIALVGLLYAAMHKLAGLRTQVGASTDSAIIHWLNKSAPLILSITWLLVSFVALLRWSSLTPASQGRLLFPTVAILSTAIVYGLYRLHRVVFAAGLFGIVALSIAVPISIIAPAYAKPPHFDAVKPQQQLDANYGSSLTLIGYDSAAASVQPGESATLTLYWHASAPLARIYSVYVHLVSEDGIIVAQRDMYPGQGSIATSELVPGYMWSDYYTLVIPQLTLAPQNLTWIVGLYDLQTNERLTTTHNAHTAEGLVLGSLTLAPRAVTAKPLLDYGNGIQLQRYELSSERLEAGKSFTITAYWAANKAVGTDYTVSFQLLKDDASKAAQHDSAPAGGASPTSGWQAGDIVTDTHMLDIAGDAKPGVYRLLLVLYEPSSFARLTAYDSNSQAAGTEVELTRLRVR